MTLAFDKVGVVFQDEHLLSRKNTASAVFPNERIPFVRGLYWLCNCHIKKSLVSPTQWSEVRTCHIARCRSVGNMDLFKAYRQDLQKHVIASHLARDAQMQNALRLSAVYRMYDNFLYMPHHPCPTLLAIFRWFKQSLLSKPRS